jgi:hypothetical protein
MSDLIGQRGKQCMLLVAEFRRCRRFPSGLFPPRQWPFFSSTGITYEVAAADIGDDAPIRGS